MLNACAIRLSLLVTAWMVSEVICDSCSSSCMKSILKVPCVPLRDDYMNVPGIGAYKLHTNPADWNTAQRTCQQEGGNLAVPNSVAEAKAIAKVFTNSGEAKGVTILRQALIGFHDQFKEGDYVTIFDQPLSKSGFNTFSGTGPDNLNDAEDCGAIVSIGLLNDISCSNKNEFVCELALCNSCLSR